MPTVVILVRTVNNTSDAKRAFLGPCRIVRRRYKFTCDVRNSDSLGVERSQSRAWHIGGLHRQPDETRDGSYFQSIMPALSAQARTCSLQRSMTERLASKKSER